MLYRFKFAIKKYVEYKAYVWDALLFLFTAPLVFLWWVC